MPKDKNFEIEIAETPMALGGGGIAPLKPKKDFTSGKFYNEQCLNTPKAGWNIRKLLGLNDIGRTFPKIHNVGWGSHPNKTAAFTLSEDSLGDGVSVGQALPDKNKVAYTLAEVILVIGIIGIVAALTIPQLIQNTNNKDLVSAFLKSNNVLANAYKNAKAVDNIHKMAPDDFKKTFKEYLKTYECTEHDICLQDSMFVDFTCNETSCTELTVNTNGDKKPNQAGKDKFKFFITQEGIIPQGETEQCSGYDCGMYTLTYHKIFEGLTPNCVAYHEGKCSSCDDGYHLEDNKTCSAINFPTCAVFEGEECKTCQSNYLLQDKDCISMDTLKCASTDDGKTCKTCIPGNILTEGLCKTLDEVDCLTKSDTEACSQCKNTYQNNNGVCEPGAITGCQVYSGLACQNCGDKLLQNNHCYDVIGGCATQNGNICQTCDSTHIGNGTATCSYCGDNRHSYNNTCYNNIPNCKGSNYATTCSECNPGYTKSISSIACYAPIKSIYQTSSTNWSSAYNDCVSRGMKLATLEEARTFSAYVPSDIQYWSADVSGNYAYAIVFAKWTGSTTCDPSSKLDYTNVSTSGTSRGFCISY